MPNNEKETEKVVKCSECGKYFGYSDKNRNCPFPSCRTPYVEVGGKEKKSTPKKLKVKPRKESFKMWKGKSED